MANFMLNSYFSPILDIYTLVMCHMLPFALYSDIQNLLGSASAIRHCVNGQPKARNVYICIGMARPVLARLAGRGC
jgi:hypothetical protein